MNVRPLRSALRFLSAAHPQICETATVAVTAIRSLAFGPTAPCRDEHSRRRYKHKVRVTYPSETNPLAKPTRLDPSVLYLTSVPIGNVKDFSLRSLETLRQVDYILCANRQATQVLLDIVDVDHHGRLVHYTPEKPGSNRRIVDLVKGGASVAFVCPTGTPVVGDTGDALVREMLASGVRVSAIPGASAVVGALSISGVRMGPGGSFSFQGWLSTKAGQRRGQLRKAVDADHPTVFYDAPERLLTSLQDLSGLAPLRRVAVVHEFTKAYESVHCDTAQRLVGFYSRGSNHGLLTRGEATMIVEGDDSANAPLDRLGRLQHRSRENYDGLEIWTQDWIHAMVRSQLLLASASVATEASPHTLRQAFAMVADGLGKAPAIIQAAYEAAEARRTLRPPTGREPSPSLTSCRTKSLTPPDPCHIETLPSKQQDTVESTPQTTTAQRSEQILPPIPPPTASSPHFDEVFCEEGHAEPLPSASAVGIASAMPKHNVSTAVVAPSCTGGKAMANGRRAALRRKRDKIALLRRILKAA